MPAIIIKDYTWRETSEFLVLNVPLTGHPKKVDLFVIDNYVKVSFPPFILELFLWSNVNEEESNCTLTNQEAILTLRKTDPGVTWPTLELQDIDSETKRKYRNRALERAQTMAQERAKVESEKRQHLQKAAVKAQINVDTAILNKISAIRDLQRKEAMQEFEEWKSKAEVPLLPAIEGKVQENRKAYRPPLKWFKDSDGTLRSKQLTEEEILNNNSTGKSIQSTALKSVDSKEASSESNESNAAIVSNEIKTRPKEESEKDIKKEGNLYDDSNDSDSSENSNFDYDIKPQARCSIKEIDEKEVDKIKHTKKSERTGKELLERVMKGKLVKRNSIFDEPAKSVPLPRRSGTINVTFSERHFPTPARESSYLEEQEWLQKQAEARRKTGFVSEDLRPEERDPQWLKDKGDAFFKVGNYLGAISAYTHGIKISDKMSSLYVNRSAAHYALGNYHRCLEDSSKALELMEPKCEGNRESRARCHARRGAALCKLSAPQHGIPELETALKLAPENESIKRDLLAAKQYFDARD